MTTLTLERLTASIGAEVMGVQLKSAVEHPDSCAAIRDALWNNLVLCFRDQFLDDDAHLAVAKIFGDPLVTAIGRAFGQTNPIEEVADNATKLPDRDGWHTDAPFLTEPPCVAVLRALHVPEAGGDTLWSNMYAAFDALSPAMQKVFTGMRIQYPPQQGLLDYVEQRAGKEMADKVRMLVGSGGEHPIVRTHPETGRRALYFAKGFGGPIVGLSESESACLWGFLAPLPSNPSIQCRWHWRAGDVVIWDERATQHFGVADHRGQDRVLRRIMVTGEVPR